MWNEELERRAAQMRERHSKPASPATEAEITRGQRGRKTSTSTSAAITHVPTAVVVPGLPEVGPHALLQGVWRPAHTNALLSALGDVDPLVVRTARSIAKQQVGFDGVIALGGSGVLEVAASPQSLPLALHLYNLLLVKVRERGGEVTAPNGTVIRWRGETVRIRLRECAERGDTTGTDSYRSNTYRPTGRLSFAVVPELGGDCKMPVTDTHSVETFLDKVDRLINRLPRLRDQRARREREQEEWRAQINERIEREQNERRQWREQQDRFDQLINDIEQWGKAERVRAYAASAEAYLSKDGPIEVGGKIDGWLRWMHWYADHLDPMTRPDGPKQRPE
jgi:hypothetical protein